MHNWDALICVKAALPSPDVLLFSWNHRIMESYNKQEEWKTGREAEERAS